ncbi:hypothetical protein HXX76_015679 [Chlamydomonas incerta]|uniref:Uncharacterized protein n=1 Tax=Chlamydomonas incerta TaxID=51695 RepID=A0A835SGE2_CHLIN|nr:hypothetical protein HXX76_015679 [Chlamydomonas incerta]|eukprot:KAG2422928.1 hypothetical protein HXX76_015679 [Chlamydomonas incerta]
MGQQLSACVSAASTVAGGDETLVAACAGAARSLAHGSTCAALTSIRQHPQLLAERFLPGGNNVWHHAARTGNSVLLTELFRHVEAVAHELLASHRRRLPGLRRLHPHLAHLCELQKPAEEEHEEEEEPGRARGSSGGSSLAAAGNSSSSSSTGAGSGGSLVTSHAPPLAVGSALLAVLLCLPNAAGLTPLMLAAGSGQATAVALLLRKGADPWAAEPRRAATALHAAAAGGHYMSCKLLLGLLPGPDSPFAALHCQHPSLQRRQAPSAEQGPLVQGAEEGCRAWLLSARTAAGATALHLAVAGGHAALAELLLAHGAELGAQVLPPRGMRLSLSLRLPLRQRPPSYTSSGPSANTSPTSTLLHNPALPTPTSSTSPAACCWSALPAGATALHLAAAAGDVATVLALLRHYAAREADNPGSLPDPRTARDGGAHAPRQLVAEQVAEAAAAGRPAGISSGGGSGGARQLLAVLSADYPAGRLLGSLGGGGEDSAVGDAAGRANGAPGSGPAARAGVPTLAALAGAALHRALLSRLSHLEAQGELEAAGAAAAAGIAPGTDGSADADAAVAPAAATAVAAAVTTPAQPHPPQPQPQPQSELQQLQQLLPAAGEPDQGLGLAEAMAAPVPLGPDLAAALVRADTQCVAAITAAAAAAKAEGAAATATGAAAAAAVSRPGPAGAPGATGAGAGRGLRHSDRGVSAGAAAAAAVSSGEACSFRRQLGTGSAAADHVDGTTRVPGGDGGGPAAGPLHSAVAAGTGGCGCSQRRHSADLAARAAATAPASCTGGTAQWRRQQWRQWQQRAPQPPQPAAAAASSPAAPPPAPAAPLGPLPNRDAADAVTAAASTATAPAAARAPERVTFCGVCLEEAEADDVVGAAALLSSSGPQQQQQVEGHAHHPGPAQPRRLVLVAVSGCGHVLCTACARQLVAGAAPPPAAVVRVEPPASPAAAPPPPAYPQQPQQQPASLQYGGGGVRTPAGPSGAAAAAAAGPRGPAAAPVMVAGAGWARTAAAGAPLGGGRWRAARCPFCRGGIGGFTALL